MALNQAPEKSGITLLGVWCYLLMGAASLLIVVVFGREQEAYRLARGDWPPISQAGAGAALALALVLLSRLLTGTFPAARRLERALAGLIGTLSGKQVLLLAGFSGLAEELFFRVALLDLIGPYWSTLLFAVLHCGPGRLFLLWTVMAGAVGAFLAYLALQGSGLLTLALIHAGLNLVNLRRLSRIAAAEGAEQA